MEKETRYFEKKKQHVPKPGESSWTCPRGAGALGIEEARGLSGHRRPWTRTRWPRDQTKGSIVLKEQASIPFNQVHAAYRKYTQMLY